MKKIFDTRVWPYYDDEDIKLVTDVLKSGKVNQWTGDKVKFFEKKFAEYIGTNYAIALMNGTVALDLALYALNIGTGDEVIVTPRTFIASVSSVVLRGAKPIYADIDIETQNITLESIKKVTSNKTKAIICVHLAGLSCDMDSIIKYAKENNIYIIEDCAQAHGAKYNNKRVGSIGDIGCWSFCQDKIMSTGGEGGMITLNNYELYKKAWSYKDHGKDYDMINENNNNNNGFLWLHTTLGTNYRMTEMQAVLGISLLKKLDEWILKRRRNAKILNNIFANNSYIKIYNPDEKYYHSYYKYYCFLKNTSIKNIEIINELKKYDIKCFSGSCHEVYLEKALFNENICRLENAKYLSDKSLMFMIHPTFTENDIIKIGNITNLIIINYCNSNKI